MGIKRSGGGMAAGSIAPFAGTTVPDGWLACYGQAVSRETYAALFIAIGTTHGAGDGATTFNLPDLRGRAIFGKDDMGGVAANRITSAVAGFDGRVVGGVGGGQSVTLTTAQIPSHAHTLNNPNGATAGSTNLHWWSATVDASSAKTPAPAEQIDANGGGGAHANVPPALVANYIIKT